MEVDKKQNKQRTTVSWTFFSLWINVFRVTNPSSGSFKSENYLLKYCFCGPVGHVLCSLLLCYVN